MYKRKVVLGLFSGAHLGDVICTTPLPRQIYEQYGRKVFLSDADSTRDIFANNPFVCGYSTDRSLSLNRRFYGEGHIIQRLQRGLSLTIEERPKPEIYLSQEEKSWAEKERETWPKDKPFCLVSVRAISDGDKYLHFDWTPISDVMCKEFTVIQPILTKPTEYKKYIPCHANTIVQRWSEEYRFPNAIVYQDLPLRKYIALFSVVDCFCGTISGGSHISAAFDLQSIIVVWKEQYENLRFPVLNPGLSSMAFLYPQHCIISTSCDEESMKKLNHRIEYIIKKEKQVE